MAGQIELGCGLLALGTPWGTTPEVPSDAQAQAFLEAAYESGVRFFDTAPSYRLSEERLGRFLHSLSAGQRKEVVVATKFGEYRDTAGKGFTDYSFDVVQRNLDRSLQLLGGISLLQVHKTNMELLHDPRLDEALTYARQQGIARFGLSITDPAVAQVAVQDERFSTIQLPFNRRSLNFRSAIRRAAAHQREVIVNRPFMAGQAAADGQQTFAFILAEDFDGIVLTGTTNPQHLQANRLDFEAAHRATRQ